MEERMTQQNETDFDRAFSSRNSYLSSLASHWDRLFHWISKTARITFALRAEPSSLWSRISAFLLFFEQVQMRSARSEGSGERTWVLLIRESFLQWAFWLSMVYSEEENPVPFFNVHFRIVAVTVTRVRGTSATERLSDSMTTQSLIHSRSL